MITSFNRYDLESTFEICKELLQDKAILPKAFDHILRVIMGKLFLCSSVVFQKINDLKIITTKGIHHSKKDSFSNLEEAKQSLNLQCTFPIQHNKEIWGHLGLGNSLLGKNKLSDDEVFFVQGLVSFLGLIVSYNSLIQSNDQLARTSQKHIQRLASIFQFSASYDLKEKNTYMIKTFYRTIAAEFLIKKFIALDITEINNPKEIVSAGLVKDEPLPHLDSKEKVAFIDHSTFSIQFTLSAGDEKIAIFFGKPDKVFQIDKKSDFEFITLAFQQLESFYKTKHLANQMIQNALEKRAIDEELRLAKQTQESLLLPEKKLKEESIDIFCKVVPAKEVGGDYYEVLRLNDDEILVVIADVVGKGISAAILMASLQATLRTLLMTRHPFEPLSELIAKLNNALCSGIDKGKFITLSAAIIYPEKNYLVSVNAGHNQPIVLRSKILFKKFTEGGIVLGAFPDMSYQEERFAFKKHDTIFFYTDGITEIKDAEKNEFGEQRLIELIEEVLSKDLNAENVAQAIINASQSFGNETLSQADDLTTICVKIT